MKSNPVDIGELLDWLPRNVPDLRNQEFHQRQAATAESSLAQNSPINEYDALLRAAPGDEIERHQLERQVIREAIAIAIDSLEERDRFAIEAVHFERLSYMELADRLSVSKTMAHKIVQSAQRKLQQALLLNPIIKEYLDDDS